MIGLIGTELDGEYTITTTEDGAGLSNFIVTSDDVTNAFNFSASFSDYLQGIPSTDTYFTGTAMNFINRRTQSHFNLETDTVANYDIGDQLTFSAMINNSQEVMSYTVTADDIGTNNAATAQSIATNIATELKPLKFYD